MNSLDIKLKSKNSSGEQVLFLTEDKGEYWFTLCGEHKGTPVQIDFDVMSREEIEEIHMAIGLILDEAAN